MINHPNRSQKRVHKYRVIMANEAGELDSREVFHQNHIKSAMLSMINLAQFLQPGDNFRVEEIWED